MKKHSTVLKTRWARLNYHLPYPVKPFVLWEPSQNGLFADAPHLHKETPLGFSIMEPSAMVITQGPETFAGPLLITFTFKASGDLGSIVSISGGLLFFIEMAPVGQA